MSVAILLFAASVAVEAPVAKPMKIAVLDLQAERNVDESLVRMLNELVLTEFTSTGKLDVFGGSDLRAMLELEGAKQTFGCDDESCLAEVGAALGVDNLVVAGIGKIGSAYLLNMKAIDVRNATVMGRVSEHIRGGEEGLVEAVRAGARKLVEALLGNAAPKTSGGASSAEPTSSGGSVAATDPTPTEPPASVVVSQESGGIGWLPWSLLGAGLVSAGLGAFLGNSARADATDRDSATDLASWRSKNDSAEGKALGATIAFAVAGAAVAAGSGLMVWSLMDDSKTTAAIAPLPGGAVVVVRY